MSEIVSDRIVKPICSAPLSAACQRRLALLDKARNILDHHDRVVDDKPGRDRERHQSEVVEAVAQQIHDAEGTDQRERDGDTGDDGRGKTAQEQKDDQHHQHDGEHQLEFHIGYRGANGGRPVGQDRHLDRGGKRGLQPRHQRLDLVDHCDDVRARLTLHIQDHRRDVVHPGGLLDVLGLVDDVCDIGQEHRRAIAIGYYQRLINLGGEQLIIGADGVGLALAVEVALRLIDVGGRHYSAKLLQREPVRRELNRVRLDPHRRLLSAADTYQPDARHLRNLFGQARIGEVLDLIERQLAGSEPQRQDRRVGRVGLAIDRRRREDRSADRSPPR